MKTKLTITGIVLIIAITAFDSSAQDNNALSTGIRELTSVHDTIYSENFDDGAPGWTFQDLWSESFWHISTTGAYSGHSYWCGIEELGGYDDIWDQTLTSPPINLSGAVTPVLSFMHNYLVQPLSGEFYYGTDAWDAMTVRLSTDGANFTVITPTAGKGYNIQSSAGFVYRYGLGMPGWAGNSMGWISENFNLAAYAGQTVWIQFLFGSDEKYSSQDNANLFGWRIDNIKIADGTATIFEDDAGDTGTAQFINNGPGGPNPWHITSTAYASAPGSAGCFDNVSGNYFSDMKAALVSPAISIQTLMQSTRKLIADFKYKGVFGNKIDSAGIADNLYTEVRKFSGGVWSYWQFLSGDDFVPDAFYGYNEKNFFDLDASDLIGADSIQFRIYVLTQPDNTVIPPANLFIDDFVLYTTSGYEGPQFGAFYDRIMSVPEQERTSIADSFMLTVPSFPFVEENSIVTFLYRGEANTVTVPGDANIWDSQGSPMTRITGTNLWVAQSVFEPDARLEYKFVLNNVNWITDPRNPHHINYGGGNSEIEMPDYIPPTEIEYLPGISHGTYNDTLFHSTIIGNSRTIRVYLPPSYMTDVNDSFPVVLFHDGLEYFDCGSVNNILDYLISTNRIQPVIAVFVPPVNRDAEYAFDQTSQFESFIITELMPVIDTKYRTMHDPASRAMVGYSYGGLITTQICYNNPESFGLCAPFSPSYWPKGCEVVRNLANGPKKNIKFYIDCGTYEPYFLPNAMIMRDILINLGYNPVWNQWHEGHCCGNWRAHLDLALEYFFPPKFAGVENIETDQSSLKCYPNPSTGKITIEISDKTNNRSLSVLDLTGQQIITCQITPPGITLDISTLPSGVYFVKVAGDNRMQVGKFVKQ